MAEITHIKDRPFPLGRFASGTVSFGFSRRSSGNMSLCYGDTRHSLRNRKIFLGSLGINHLDLVCAKQVHSGNVRYATDSDRASGAISYDSAIADTDSFITDKKNLPLAIFTADCLSVFIYDPKNCAVGLAHAGWRSTRAGILTCSIKSMQERFNSQPEELWLSFGPSIRGCCYRVGSDFHDLFPGKITQKGGHNYLDLISLNRQQAMDCAVKEERIFDSGICTSCQNREFFSYRKEGKDCGRLISVIMLKG